MWKGFSALPNYIGGKRRLCPEIFREIAQVYPPWQWPSLTFLDPFMGGGSVSLFAKAQGFKVRATDLAHRCVLVGKGIIANNDRKLTDQDLGLLFAEDGDYEPFVQNHFTPQTFSPVYAKFLDRALANIRRAELDEIHEALLYTALIRAMLLVRTGGQMTNLAWCTNMSAGNFDAISQGQLKSGYAKTWGEPPPIKMRKVQQHINGGIFPGDAQITQDDALVWLPEQPGDVVYLDPPYFGSTSYEANYHILECILAGRMLPTIPISPFNRAATAWSSLVEMFEVVEHVPLWVISLAENLNGFSRQQINSLVEDFDRHTHIVELHHRWSLATTSDHYVAGSKEILIIARK